MRVAWDARILVNGEIRGMGTYAFHVLRAMRECRPDLELTLFHDRDDRTPPIDGYQSARIGPSRGYRWQLWEQVGLPLQAYMRGCRLLHSPANTTPPHCPITRIVTLHDAMPFLPWNESADPLPYFAETQRRALKRADAIITDSAYSKHDISDTLGIDASRIAVIPLAPSPDLHRPSDEQIATTLKACNVRQPFIVGLAATALRKNTKGLLAAFAELQHDARDVSLVLTGVGKHLEPAIVNEMDRLQIPHDRVRRLGFVDQATLAALYAACSAFWFLSLYEGFGLPILDAMQCGAPVICSTRTSCPEVAGDAAIMVDPETPAEIAAATVEVLRRDDAARQMWRRRAEAHARTFTWTRTAEMTARIYDQVGGA